jgi:DNA-binding HxlR family transcriptional regulator
MALTRTRLPAAAAAPALDDTIHQRVRLGIVSALAAGGPMSFNDLKAVLDLTDGNLSVHARKLEDAGYVACHKFFADRMPRTEYSLTDAGRTALEAYLDQMEALVQSVKGDH